jgi:hypothetical protein
MVESTTTEKRQACIGALHQIAVLKPATVVASHKSPEAANGINNMYSTIEYIETFGNLKAQSGDASVLYHKMMESYPDRINPVVLWLVCQSNFSRSGPRNRNHAPLGPKVC